MFAEINEKYGGADVCVNNAGLAINAPLLSGKTEDWGVMMDVRNEICQNSILLEMSVKTWLSIILVIGNQVGNCTVKTHHQSAKQTQSVSHSDIFCVTYMYFVNIQVVILTFSHCDLFEWTSLYGKDDSITCSWVNSRIGIKIFFILNQVFDWCV